MDPVTALGAAAAGAQFVGLAVKSALGSAKLIQDIRDEPKRAIELLTWVENEVTSMQTLLHPESSVFSHLTTNQYVQIAPHAIKARKAMDKVNNVISPLVRDIDSLKNRDDVGKRIMLIWKSILTVKSMKRIETDLGIIRLLNATLLRELQVCGLETQSLLRNQSTQVLCIVNDLAKRDEELRRSMDQINVSTTNLVQTVTRIRDAGDVQHQEVLRMHMMQMAYLQAIQDKMGMTEVHTRVGSEANSGPRTESEASAVDVVKFCPEMAGKGARSLRCRCRSNMVSETRRFGPFAYKTGRQASQVCPLHGRIGQKSYSIEANLSPWANGFLQLSLGMLFQGGTWSILPPLKFQGTVKRSESPIFRLIDDFISSCSTMEKWNYYVTGIQGPLEDNAYNEYIRLSWDSQRTKDELAGVLHGIEEAAATGLASYSDMDERGSTLLTELALLFAFLGEEILNVEAEILQLFRIAFNAKLDPTVPLGAIHDIRDYKVEDWEEPELKIGDILVNYAMETGTISASLYNAFLDYEGLAESTRFDQWRHSSSYTVEPLGKVVRLDPVLAEVAGYGDLSLAIISRSLAKLRKCLSTNSRDDSLTNQFMFSPLELALG
ncbi:hypothetical protein BJ166DRAFT_306454 [Pestalotiopsis sp. NC0098]|nr:hypothetical protein BJ166DRAFT_306454 [Pestalotiopsis sp. NC0098]